MLLSDKYGTFSLRIVCASHSIIGADAWRQVRLQPIVGQARSNEYLSRWSTAVNIQVNLWQLVPWLRTTGFLGAKFYFLQALFDGSYCLWIRKKAKSIQYTLSTLSWLWSWLLQFSYQDVSLTILKTSPKTRKQKSKTSPPTHSVGGGIIVLLSGICHHLLSVVVCNTPRQCICNES